MSRRAPKFSLEIRLKSPICRDEVRILPVPEPFTIPSRLAGIPAFPSVAMKLLALLADGDCDFSDIAACIASDPVLSGQLLKRANAADQPHYCEVQDVLRAATALGLDRTREVSLSAATSVYARPAMRSEILRPCWRHTLACAIAASEVARVSGIRAAEPYTAGLLHDIGRLGLLSAYPTAYEEIMTRAGTPGELIALERERFDVDHIEAGAWLARRWNLPEPLTEAIARHHEAPAGALDQVTVTQIACRLADMLGFSVIPSDEPLYLDEIAGALPEGTRKRLDARLRFLQDAIGAEIQFLESPEGPTAGSGAVTDGEEPQENGPPPGDSPADPASKLAILAAVLAVVGLLLSLMPVFLRR